MDGETFAEDVEEEVPKSGHHPEGLRLLGVHEPVLRLPHRRRLRRPTSGPSQDRLLLDPGPRLEARISSDVVASSSQVLNRVC